MRGKLLVISLIVGIVLLYFTLVHTNFSELWIVISRLNPLWLLLYVVVSFFIYLTLALRWKIIAKTFGYDIKLFRIMLYRLAGHSISYLTPSAKMGGEPVRAALLAKHDNKKDFQKALATVGIDKIFELAFIGIYFFIGALIVGLATPNISKGMSITLIGLGSLFLLSTILFYIQTLKGRPFFTVVLNGLGMSKLKELALRFEATLTGFYKNHRKAFWITALLNTISWLLMFLEYKTALLAFGFNANIGLLFLTFSMVGVAYILPIPLAIGSLEAGQVSLSKLSELTTSTALGLALLVRIRDLLISFIGLIVIGIEGIGVVKAIKTQPGYYVTISNVGTVKIWDRTDSKQLIRVYKKTLFNKNKKFRYSHKSNQKTRKGF